VSFAFVKHTHRYIDQVNNKYFSHARAHRPISTAYGVF